MGDVSLLTIVLGAVAFFAVGALWYGPLFGKAWQSAADVTDEQVRGGNMALIFSLAFAFELLVSLMLAHQFAMTSPSDRGKMMIAIGYGLTLMVPAIGINYLFQRRSGKLFAIDAGHFVLGMAAMGAVYVLMD